MTFIPGHKKPADDTTIEIAPALLRQLALHVVEYADRNGLTAAETRDLLGMLGWPLDQPVA